MVLLRRGCSGSTAFGVGYAWLGLGVGSGRLAAGGVVSGCRLKSASGGPAHRKMTGSAGMANCPGDPGSVPVVRYQPSVSSPWVLGSARVLLRYRCGRLRCIRRIMSNKANWSAACWCGTSGPIFAPPRRRGNNAPGLLRERRGCAFGCGFQPWWVVSGWGSLLAGHQGVSGTYRGCKRRWLGWMVGLGSRRLHPR